MKTIEERASEYVDGSCEADCALCQDICHKTTDRIAFIAGAEWMRAELTGWHDPKKELPEDERIVLTRKAKDGEWRYMVAGYASEIRKWITTYHKVYVDMGLSPLDVEDYLPDGWREIHE